MVADGDESNQNGSDFEEEFDENHVRAEFLLQQYFQESRADQMHAPDEAALDALRDVWGISDNEDENYWDARVLELEEYRAAELEISRRVHDEE